MSKTRHFFANVLDNIITFHTIYEKLPEHKYWTRYAKKQKCKKNTRNLFTGNFSTKIAEKNISKKKQRLRIQMIRFTTSHGVHQMHNEKYYQIDTTKKKKKAKKKAKKIQHHTVPTWSPTVVLSRPNVA